MPLPSLDFAKLIPLRLTMDALPWGSRKKRKKEEVIARIKDTFRRHQPPIFVGDYIGSGGFADVYKAISNYNGVTKFAIKILRSNLITPHKGPKYNPVKEEMRIKDIKKRFTNESYVQWALSQNLSERVSQSVVRVYDHGEFDIRNRFRFILMERMASTLRDYINSVHQAETYDANVNKVMLMTKIADLIRNVHNEGIIHRDIKPENIFFCRFDDSSAALDLRPWRRKYERNIRVKLGDFGTVRWVRTYNDRFDGVIIGSQWYLSPEQIFHPEHIDIRADIYSFGIVCYELLYHAFPKDVNRETKNLLEKLARAKPVVRTPPRGFEPLNDIIFKCLDEVNERYQSMEQVVTDLRHFLSTLNEGSP